MKVCPVLLFLSLASACTSTDSSNSASPESGEMAEMSFAVESAGPPMPTPGPEHAVLQRLVGDWDAKISMGESMSEGEYKIRSGPGGFSIHTHFTAEFDGSPFEGRGIDSWSPEKRRFVTIWTDSWMDHPLVLEGTWDEASQSLVMEGDDLDPQSIGSEGASAPRHEADRQGPHGVPAPDAGARRRVRADPHDPLRARLSFERVASTSRAVPAALVRFTGAARACETVAASLAGRRIGAPWLSRSSVRSSSRSRRRGAGRCK